MTTHNYEPNDAIFDRLVDGELSPHDRHELLASLDQSDDGWRRCALAFLEAQAWGREMKAFVAEPAPSQVHLPVVRSTSSTVFSAARWLALAASLLLAFYLGKAQTPSNSKPAQPPLVAESAPPAFPLAAENPDDAITLLVRDVHGQQRRLQVPLIDMPQADQFAGALSPEVRNQFLDRGFDLERRRRYAPMFFEQDQELVPMVVPVEDTRIVPVNREFF